MLYLLLFVCAVLVVGAIRESQQRRARACAKLYRLIQAKHCTEIADAYQHAADYHGTDLVGLFAKMAVADGWRPGRVSK